MGCILRHCVPEEVCGRNGRTVVTPSKIRDGAQRTILIDDFVGRPSKRVKWDNKSPEVPVFRKGSNFVKHLKTLERNHEEESFSEKFDEISLTPRQQLYTMRGMVRKATIKSSDIGLPRFSQGSRFLSKIESPHSSYQFRDQLISDWASVFDGFHSALSTSRQSSNVNETDDIDTAFFSENDLLSSMDRMISIPSCIISETQPKPGIVLAMFLLKKSQRFEYINLCMTLEDVVATYLSIGDNSKLPVSVTYSKEETPVIYGRSRMAVTLAQNLGPKFDAKSQGLLFTTGTVNSKLCHKMCVCDLRQLQKFFYHSARRECKSLE